MSTSFRQIVRVSRNHLPHNGLSDKNAGMWHKKLRAACGMQRITAASISRETGWSYNTIRNYLDGVTQPRYDTLLWLCRRANVSIEWVVDDSIPDLPVVLRSPAQQETPSVQPPGVIRVRDLPPPKSAVKRDRKKEDVAKAPPLEESATKRGRVTTPRPKRGK